MRSRTLGRWWGDGRRSRNPLRPGSQLHGEREWTCRLGYALAEEAPKHEFGRREVETVEKGRPILGAGRLG
jgi:hypothetical protein